MNELTSIIALRKVIELAFGRVKALMPEGDLTEFSEEELVMIATGLDKVTELINDIEEKVAILQRQMSNVEGSISSMERDLSSQIATKSDLSHLHDDRYYTESEVDELVSTKSDTTHNHDSVYSKLSHTHDYAASNHTHTASAIGAAAASHTHDDRYYTESEMNTKLSTKSDTSHTHALATSSVNGFMSADDKSKLDLLGDNTWTKFHTRTGTNKITLIRPNQYNELLIVAGNGDSSDAVPNGGSILIPNPNPGTEVGVGGTYYFLGVDGQILSAFITFQIAFVGSEPSKSYYAEITFPNTDNHVAWVYYR